MVVKSGFEARSSEVKSLSGAPSMEAPVEGQKSGGPNPSLFRGAHWQWGPVLWPGVQEAEERQSLAGVDKLPRVPLQPPPPHQAKPLLRVSN